MLDLIRQRLAAAISPSKAQGDLFMTSIGNLQRPGVPVYSDMTVSKATREGYKISIYVYRSIRKIIELASGIPWTVLDRNGEIIADHPLTSVMQRPNPEMSGQDLMEFLLAHLKLVGNALWQPLIVGGSLREIWPVMPDLVRPVPSDVQGEWLKGWMVREGTSGRERLMPPGTFIHFQEVDPGNPYWGTAPLMAAARTVDTDNEAQDTQKISMQNRGTPDGVFTHDSPLTTQQFEEARRQVHEKYIDKTRRREPWVVGAGTTWQQMSLTPVEMDFIASRLANLRAIATAFGLDPWMLGDRSASTYNNVREARRAAYEDVVIPTLDDIQATLNLRVAPLYGGDITISYDTSNVEALRSNYGEKVTQAQALWAMGVPFRQINDQLEMGLEEFPGWDSGYLPFSVMPVGAPVQTAKTKALNMETEEQKSTLWKRIDRRRLAWWNVAAKRIAPLYEAEADAVVRAVRGGSSVSEAIRGNREAWEKMMTSLLVAVVEDFGTEIADDLGSEPKARKWRFDPFTTASRAWIAERGADAITSILDTNLADVQRVILQGRADNLTVTQIGSNLRRFYDDGSANKAMRVARTEVTAAASFGNLEAARQSGGVSMKGWLSSRDDRVRDSHISMDGERVPLNGVFSNGCTAPGIGGDASETIQCRCVLQFFSGGEI